MSELSGAPSTDTDVVIVGGGPVGVCLALLLGRRGIRSVIVERHENVYPLPRAVHLDDEVYRILDEIGVAAGFAAISRSASGLRLVDARHRTIAQFDRDASPASGLPQANLFDQPELEELLRARLQTEQRCTTLFGWTVTGLDQDADGVRIAATATDGKAVEIRAAFAVGCDGANSWTRQRLGIRAVNLGFEQRWIVIDGRTETLLDAWGGVDQICDPSRPGTFMRVGPDRYRWEFRLDADESTAAWDEDRVRIALAPWTERAGGASVELLRVAEYTFKAELAERWREGRAFLAGDAAHLTPPFIGQGLGSGLRDATNLAWKLAAAVGGRAPEGLLDSYENERRPHAEALIRKAMMIGRIMTGRELPARVVRAAVMPLASHIRPVEQQILTSVTPPIDQTGLAGYHRRRGSGGTLLPRIPVEDGRGGSSVDGMLSDPLTLIVLDGGAPADAPPIPTVAVTRAGAPHEQRLAAWLRRAGASWAIIRPDRSVLASGSARAPLPPPLANLVSSLVPAPPRSDSDVTERQLS